MSSTKKVLYIAVMALIVVTISGLIATTTMAQAKTIHSVTGDFRAVSSWQKTVSTWYGPGFYGNQTASGKIMLSNCARNVQSWKKHPRKYILFGAANPNQSLPLGTWVEINYNGVHIVIEVADRGPNSRTLELMGATRSYLDYYGKKLLKQDKIKHYTIFSGNQTLSWRIVKKI